MKQRACALGLLALMVLMAGCRPQPVTTGRESAGSARGFAQPAGSGFDYYLLNLSWSPEFCYSHPTAAECATHSTFVLHGLWPENNDGTYPENCSSMPAPTDLFQYSDLYPDQGLLLHEWRTHGTCSGLSADAYFATVRTARKLVKIPPKLASLNAQTSMTPDDIVELFAESNPGIPRASLALSCGHNYLTAVEVCLDKSLQPVPCSGVSSCRANTVRVLAPE